jgi:hypothetical protein
LQNAEGIRTTGVGKRLLTMVVVGGLFLQRRNLEGLFGLALISYIGTTCTLNVTLCTRSPLVAHKVICTV